MSKVEEINLAKRRFVNRFPITNGAKDCARYGIDAAAGRSHLYSPNTNHLDIREYWIKQLIIIGEKYKDKQTLETFKSDILALKESMNSKFPGRFINGHSDYDNEFRISHAQKSLSIFLKHMWCNNLITVLPPVCPIDGVILKYCGSNDSWTKVNSIKSYEEHLALVERQRKTDNIGSLPEWEVWAFNKKQDSPKGQKETAKKRNSKRKGQNIKDYSISRNSIVTNAWFNVETRYSHKSNGRELVFSDSNFKNIITEHYNAGETLEIELDGREIIIKADNPYKYACFRQKEINNWARRKEEKGLISIGQSFTIKARFIHNEKD